MVRFAFAPMENVRDRPVHAVEQALGRHHVVFVLELSLREVKYGLSSKIPGDYAVFRDAYYRVFSIDRWVHRLEHVDVVPAPDAFVAVVFSRYWPVVPHGLVQRRKALLTVEQEYAGLDLVDGRPLDWARPEFNFGPGVERHDCADWEPPGNAGEQAANPVIVPYPTSLEVWELDVAVVDLLEQDAQWNRVGPEHGLSSLSFFQMPPCGCGLFNEIPSDRSL